MNTTTPTTMAATGYTVVLCDSTDPASQHLGSCGTWSYLSDKQPRGTAVDIATGARHAVIYLTEDRQIEYVNGAVRKPEPDKYIEALISLAEGFRQELCPECGQDLDRHVISPDPFGLPHARCTPTADEA